MVRLVVVKFHIDIANRWLFMTQGKIMAIILYSYSYLDMFRGAVFFRTRCIRKLTGTITLRWSVLPYIAKIIINVCYYYLFNSQ